MNKTVAGKRDKPAQARLTGVNPGLANTPGDLLWEIDNHPLEFEQNLVGVVILRADGIIAHVNAFLAHLFGGVPVDFIGKRLLDFVPEKDKAAGAKAVQACLSGDHQPVRFETAINGKDGKTVDLLVNAMAGVFQGQPAAIGVVIDISDRKQAERALVASHSLLKNVLENTPVRVFWKDTDLRYLGCNTAFAHDAGMSRPEDMIGKDDFQMNWKEQAEMYNADDRQVMVSGEPIIGREEPQTTPDGDTIWLRTSKVPLRDADGEVFGMLGMYEDITRQRAAEQALSASELKLQTALANMSKGLVLLDAAGGLKLFNRRFVEIFGLPQDQILPGMTVRDLMALAASNSDVRDLDPDGTIAHVEKTVRETEAGSFVVNLSDGRIIADSYQPMPDGGIVATFEDITQKKAEEQALADSEAKLQAALANMSQGLVMLDAEGRLAVSNRRFAEIFGLSQDQIPPGMILPELMALAASNSGVRDLDPEGTIAHVMKTVRETEAGSFNVNLSDGRTIADTYQPMPDGGMVVTFEDITQKTQAEQALKDSEAKLQAALANMTQGLLMIDAEGKLVLHNARLVEMYGLPPELIKTGMSVLEALDLSAATTGLADVDPDATLAQLARVLSDPKGGTYVQQLNDGRSISATFQPMPGGGLVVTFEDITQRLVDQAEIRHMAQFDALTNLPNRVSFYEQMDTILKHLRRDESIGVLSLDLDHFKAVNDTLGHPIGDRLLQAAARRMQSCLRKGDIVARLGGDEFAVLQIPGDHPVSITALANRLIEIVGASYDFDGNQVIVGISVGVAVAPGDGNEPDDLMKNADLALYRAKADGGGVCRFFEPEMDARMRARRVIELDLRNAIENGGEFELLYQPMVDVKTRKVTSCEALLRWNSPERGMIMPDDFIPVAEATGLIVPLGEWVLRQACVEAMRWPEEIAVAVNLSPAQFKSKALVDTVKAALAESGLPASRLELEITEQVLMNESDGVFTILNQIRDLGIRIAMDDFGTGYSSIGYLRAFPFSKIKIDQSFIRDLPGKEDSLAIVRAVVGLSSSLGIVTTAEGVETEEQLASVTSEGCNTFQGFVFSKPRPGTEVLQFFKEQAEGAVAAYPVSEDPLDK